MWCRCGFIYFSNILAKTFSPSPSNKKSFYETFWKKKMARFDAQMRSLRKYWAKKSEKFFNNEDVSFHSIELERLLPLTSFLVGHQF